MKKTDFIGGFIWIILGCVIIQQSLALKYWSTMGPGPGFMPFWSGVLISVGGLMLLFCAYSKSKKGNSVESSSIEKGNPLFLGLLIVLIIFFVFLMEPLGFALSMFFLLLILIMLTRKHSKKLAFVISFVVISGFYFLFSYCLRIPLPNIFIFN